MEIQQQVMMGEEELEEAILEYINKHKHTNYESMSRITFLNGGVEESVLFTSLKFEVM